MLSSLLLILKLSLQKVSDLIEFKHLIISIDIFVLEVFQKEMKVGLRCFTHQLLDWLVFHLFESANLLKEPINS